jgi:hypothetical protein
MKSADEMDRGEKPTRVKAKQFDEPSKEAGK